LLINNNKIVEIATNETVILSLGRQLLLPRQGDEQTEVVVLRRIVFLGFLRNSPMFLNMLEYFFEKVVGGNINL